MRSELVTQICRSAELLGKEIEIQRLLCREETGPVQLDVQYVLPSEVLQQIEAVFGPHPAAADQSLTVEYPEAEAPIGTDMPLLLRVLGNMVLNAIESGQPGDQVRIWVEESAGSATFLVWNRQAIPEHVGIRVFQRYFSTKPGGDRGTGTFAMKLLGENLLNGKVSYSSSEPGGTTFRICLPRKLETPRQ